MIINELQFQTEFPNSLIPILSKFQSLSASQIIGILILSFHKNIAFLGIPIFVKIRNIVNIAVIIALRILVIFLYLSDNQSDMSGFRFLAQPLN